MLVILIPGPVRTYHYNLFHFLVELSSVSITTTPFMITWSSFQYTGSAFHTYMSLELRAPVGGIHEMMNVHSSHMEVEERQSCIDLVKDWSQSLLTVAGDIRDQSRN